MSKNNGNVKYVSSLLNPQEILLNESPIIISQTSTQRSRFSLSLLPSAKSQQNKTLLLTNIDTLDSVEEGSRIGINNSVQYCEKCRCPSNLFRNVKQFENHKKSCSIVTVSLRKCDKGNNCNSNNIFHYKHYSHCEPNLLEEQIQLDLSISNLKKNVQVKNSKIPKGKNYYLHYPDKNSENHANQIKNLKLLEQKKHFRDTSSKHSVTSDDSSLDFKEDKIIRNKLSLNKSVNINKVQKQTLNKNVNKSIKNSKLRNTNESDYLKSCTNLEPKVVLHKFPDNILKSNQQGMASCSLSHILNFHDWNNKNTQQNNNSITRITNNENSNKKKQKMGRKNTPRKKSKYNIPPKNNHDIKRYFKFVAGPVLTSESRYSQLSTSTATTLVCTKNVPSTIDNYGVSNDPRSKRKDSNCSQYSIFSKSEIINLDDKSNCQIVNHSLEVNNSLGGFQSEFNVSQKTLDSLRQVLPRNRPVEDDQVTLVPIMERSKISVSETCYSACDTNFDLKSLDRYFRHDKPLDNISPLIHPKKRKIYDSVMEMGDKQRVSRKLNFTPDLTDKSNSLECVNLDTDDEFNNSFSTITECEDLSSVTYIETKSQDLVQSSIESYFKNIKTLPAKYLDSETCLAVSTELKFPNKLEIHKSDTNRNNIFSRSTLSKCVIERQCPNCKLIQGAPFAVDAFCYGAIPKITHYFLTHFHWDHYRGLNNNFNYPIYCSTITARLIKLYLNVSDTYINIINVNDSKMIEGITVTAYDANHCPGSLMFLFRIPNKGNILHVGDFRASPEMESLPCFWNMNIDCLYLDTTYCSPEYVFPSQDESLAIAERIVEKMRIKYPKLLIICGIYTIGKERAWIHLATVNNWKVWADNSVRQTLECLKDDTILCKFSENPKSAKIHLVPISKISFQFLSEHLKKYTNFTHILALRLTGWTYGKEFKPKQKMNITIQSIPYSEHSSFSELSRFVKFVRPGKVIPTVRTKLSSHTINSTIQKWCQEENERMVK